MDLENFRQHQIYGLSFPTKKDRSNLISHNHMLWDCMIEDEVEDSEDMIITGNEVYIRATAHRSCYLHSADLPLQRLRLLKFNF